MAVETPISYREPEGGFRLAYPRGWDDARLYSIALIGGRKPEGSASEGDQIATVDDFGNLVVIADKAEGMFFPRLVPRFPVWIPRGDVEVH